MTRDSGAGEVGEVKGARGPQSGRGRAPPTVTAGSGSGGPPRSAGRTSGLRAIQQARPPGLVPPFRPGQGHRIKVTETTSTTMRPAPSGDHPRYFYDATSWCLCEYPRSEG